MFSFKSEWILVFKKVFDQRTRVVVLFVRFGRDSDELTESTRDSVRFG